jgi:hypothetical protein
MANGKGQNSNGLKLAISKITKHLPYKLPFSRQRA